MTTRRFGGAISLLFAAAAFAQPTPTDNCGDAPTVTAGVVPFDTSLATNDAAAQCGGSTFSPDVWVRYIPPTSGVATFDTCADANYDTVLTAFDACGGTQLGCNDDFCTLRSRLRLPVTAGIPVLIRISGFLGDTGTGLLTVSDAAPPPANDLCSSPTPVVGGTVVTFDNFSAGTDGSSTCRPDTNFDLWYSYTAPSTGLCVVRGCDSQIGVTFAAFSACGGPEIACNPDCILRLPLVAGQTILLRVASTFESGPGQFIIEDPVSPPANETCAGATLVSSSAPVTFNMAAASLEGTSSCTPDGIADVWFQYTAPSSGVTIIDACNSQTAINLSAFDACGGNEITCSTGCILRLDLVAGQTIFVRAIAISDPGQGEIVFPDPLPPPANDDCANSQVVSSSSTTPFDSTAATTDGDSTCGGTNGADVWFSYTPASSGEVTLSTCGSDFDTVLSVFDGCGGIELACNDDECGLQSSLDLNVTTNTTYIIRVSGFGLDGGVGILNISTPAPFIGWDELVNGGIDAGELPVDAQIVLGTGPIDRITGNLDGSSADMFLINICDASNFRATTIDGVEFDSQLWLFNPDGTGVAANDDSSFFSASTLTSTFISAPGDYLLAISGYNYDPVDAGNELIWNNTPFLDERQPDGPAAANPISSWFGGSSGGPYVIRLTGACFTTGVGRCVADVDDGSGTGTRDGGVGIEDLLYYLSVYDAGSTAADVDNGTFTGTPDGGVGIEDLLYYLSRYDAGC